MGDTGAGHAVVIVGAGPTGLMLAGELALAGVDVAIVERRASQELVGWRALGFSSRTIEVLDQRGIAERFISQAWVGQVGAFAGAGSLDISDFPTRHNYGLGLPQKHIERILAGWVEELKVPVHRGLAVTGFAQDEDGVDVTLSCGRTLRARYLVGCDGGRSGIRKAAGIEFAGWDATISGLIAEVEMDEEPQWGTRQTAVGYFGFSRPDPGGAIRAQAAEAYVGKTDEPTLDDLRAAIVGVYGTDFGLRGAAWISRFTDTTRQAVSYRDRRVLLAGDAAHIHGPHGGQGLSVGVQDAVNLGWKLAQVVRGTAPDGLLDTYQAERHPVAARVLQNTMAQVALSRTDERTVALRDIFAGLLTLEEPRKRIAAMMSALDIHYDLGEGHPLLGRRMPDLDLDTADGPLRVFTLLHDARPVFLNLGEPGDFDLAGWADRVKVIDAEYAGGWELPVLGTVAAPRAVLIRPDGHVAWVAESESESEIEVESEAESGTEVEPVADAEHQHLDATLADALTTWFGPPVAVEAALKVTV
ncbi:MAG: FAD-dependent monooxygenase [Actinocrinis sp.]